MKSFDQICKSIEYSLLKEGEEVFEDFTNKEKEFIDKALEEIVKYYVSLEKYYKGDERSEEDLKYAIPPKLRGIAFGHFEQFPKIGRIFGDVAHKIVECSEIVEIPIHDKSIVKFKIKREITKEELNKTIREIWVNKKQEELDYVLSAEKTEPLLRSSLEKSFKNVVEALSDPNFNFFLRGLKREEINKYLESRKFAKLAKKLPELEGLLENKEEEKEKYVLTVTFEVDDQRSKELFEEILKYRQKETKDKTKLIQEGNKFTFIIFGMLFALKDNENLKEQFRRLFDRDLGKMFPDMTVVGADKILDDVLKNMKSSCQEEKLYNLQKKLPELEGLLENVNMNPDFSLMKEEREAIEEIAETVQRLFRDYEERLVFLMKTLKKARLSIFDTKLNKYIGVTHLRNDLRLSIGRICKKHFRVFNIPHLHEKYERVFGKSIVGNINFGEEGVDVFYEDEVFEVLFNCYDFVSGENIRSPKRIEVIEIKDYLKKLLEGWLNFILTNRSLFLPSDFLKIREEKVKFAKLQQKLPELEGLLENLEEGFEDLILTVKPADKMFLEAIPFVLQWFKDHKNVEGEVETEGKTATVTFKNINIQEQFDQWFKKSSSDSFWRNYKQTVKDVDPKHYFKQMNFVYNFKDRLAITMKNLGGIFVPYKEITKYKISDQWRSRWTDLQKKLPELEGLLESEKADFRLLIEIPLFEDKLNDKMLLKVLKQVKNAFENLTVYDYDVTLNELGNKFLFVIDNFAKIDSQEARDVKEKIFKHWYIKYAREIGFYYLEQNIKNLKFIWQNKKYDGLKKKLPELEGLLENVENLFDNRLTRKENLFINRVIDEVKFDEKAMAYNMTEIYKDIFGRTINDLTAFFVRTGYNHLWYTPPNIRNNKEKSREMLIDLFLTRLEETTIKQVRDYREERKFQLLANKLPELEGLLENQEQVEKINELTDKEKAYAAKVAKFFDSRLNYFLKDGDAPSQVANKETIMLRDAAGYRGDFERYAEETLEHSQLGSHFNRVLGWAFKRLLDKCSLIFHEGEVKIYVPIWNTEKFKLLRVNKFKEFFEEQLQQALLEHLNKIANNENFSHKDFQDYFEKRKFQKLQKKLPELEGLLEKRKKLK